MVIEALLFNFGIVVADQVDTRYTSVRRTCMFVFY